MLSQWSYDLSQARFEKRREGSHAIARIERQQNKSCENKGSEWSYSLVPRCHMYLFLSTVDCNALVTNNRAAVPSRPRHDARGTYNLRSDVTGTYPPSGQGGLSRGPWGTCFVDWRSTSMSYGKVGNRITSRPSFILMEAES